jgi:hypothetical protein
VGFPHDENAVFQAESNFGGGRTGVRHPFALSPPKNKMELSRLLGATPSEVCLPPRERKGRGVTQMKERRAARRYDLLLPVMFRAPVDEEAASGIGKTRDISNRGLYFMIDNDLSDGAKLNLKMTLPAEVSTGGSEVFIKATGKVVRVDKRSGSVDQKVGVAAVFERYEIVRSKA